MIFPIWDVHVQNHLLPHIFEQFLEHSSSDVVLIINWDVVLIISSIIAPHVPSVPKHSEANLLTLFLD
jgi:hypothetical protein